MTQLINLVKNAINNANDYKSKLTKEILLLSGMSSPKVRHFLNNVINNDSRYLEIGCWRGSTFISALYNNSPETAFAIDNWSEFNDPNFQIFCFTLIHGLPQNIFNYYTQKFIKCNYTVINEDCFKVNKEKHKIHNINTFFFDGNHEYQSQKMALEYYYDSLSQIFIFIVDDWNNHNAKNGTYDSIKELNLKILFEYIGEAKYNGDMENWWDGFFISVLQK